MSTATDPLFDSLIQLLILRLDEMEAQMEQMRRRVQQVVDTQFTSKEEDDYWTRREEEEATTCA